MEIYKEYENFCVKISKIAGNYVLNNFEGNFEIFTKDKKNNLGIIVRIAFNQICKDGSNSGPRAELFGIFSEFLVDKS